MANFIFVKETFKEGKELGFYEGVELKYGENAFKTLDEALVYYNSDAVTDKSYWNDNIFVLDKNVDVCSFSTNGVRFRPYYDADKHTDNNYKAKNKLNLKDVNFTVNKNRGYFNNFLNLNIENSTVDYVSFMGGSSREDNNGYEYKSAGTAKIKNSSGGDVSGYLNVSITDNSEINSIEIGDVLQVDDRSKYLYDKENSSQSGTRVFTTTSKMTGRVTVKNSYISGSVSNAKTVNAENAGFGEVCSHVDSVKKENWIYNTVDGIVSKVQDSVTKGTVSGSFSGKNVTVNASGVTGSPGIIGFKTVKLVNSYVNGYIGYMNYSSWASYYRTVDESSVRTYLEYDVKAAGFMTASIDKNATNDNLYKLGTIQGYKNVTIKGYNGIRYTTGKINGSNIYYKNKNNIVVEWNTFSVGTLKVTDADISGDVSGFKTVSLTNVNFVNNSSVTGGSAGKGDNSAIDIRKSYGNFTAKITDGKDYSTGNISYFENVNISGCSKKDMNATFTVGRLSGGDYETYDGGETYNFISKGTLKVKNNVVITATSNISIRYFKNVTLENNVRTTGSIKCNTYFEGKYLTSNGTLTLKNNVYVSGSVWGFKTVNMVDSHVNDSVHGEELLKSTFNLSSSSLRAHIDKFNIVNVKKGFNSAISYYGTKHNDTLTIAKNATLMLTGGTEYIMDFGEGKDKLVLNGTLVLKQHAPINLEVVTGKGTIACVANQYEVVVAALPEKYTVEVLNLGNTVDNFVSKKYEAGDDTAKKAYSWSDMSNKYKGWMAGEGGCDFADTVDFVKFNADEAVSLQFSGGADNNFKLFLNNEEIAVDSFYNIACAAGENIIEIRRETGASTTYTLAIA